MSYVMRSVCLFFLILGWAGSSLGSTCERPFSKSFQYEVEFLGSPSQVPYSKIPVGAESLLAAHRTGYLPERGGIWERPQVRGVTSLKHLKIGQSSRRNILRIIDSVEVTWNRATDLVIERCASMKRQEGNETWLSPPVIEGYKALARRGYVYSIEVWDLKGELVAGYFGVVSDGHVQGVSKFRNLSHPLSDGSGHLLNWTEYSHFKGRGFEVFDNEVATVAGRFKKQGVSSMDWAEFAGILQGLHSRTWVPFEGASVGKRFPSFKSDFPSRFREMRERGEYHLE